MDLIVSEDYITTILQDGYRININNNFAFNAITYGNGKFVAVGKDILVSFDASLNMISNCVF